LQEKFHTDKFAVQALANLELHKRNCGYGYNQMTLHPTSSRPLRHRFRICSLRHPAGLYTAEIGADDHSGRKHIREIDRPDARAGSEILYLLGTGVNGSPKKSISQQMTLHGMLHVESFSFGPRRWEMHTLCLMGQPGYVGIERKNKTAYALGHRNDAVAPFS
jgi:hypothetical protein